jgi:alkylhydroperoxidase family enzyme
MSRIAPANFEQLNSSIKKVLDAQQEKWGAPLLNHLMYARRPTIFRGARAMWTGIEGSGRIDAKLQTLINRRIASINGCEF